MFILAETSPVNSMAIGMIPGVLIGAFCFIKGIGVLASTKEDRGSAAMLWFFSGIVLGGGIAFAGCAMTLHF
jgi:hypothetical protein